VTDYAAYWRRRNGVVLPREAGTFAPAQPEQDRPDRPDARGELELKAKA